MNIMVRRASVCMWLMCCTLIIVSAFAYSQAEAANILVFGDYVTSRDALASDLQNFMGHTVTNVDTLPADLSPFDTIWHVGAFDPLTAGEQAQLAAFLASGRGIHLTGENTSCCSPLNASLQTFVNSVVSGGGILVGNSDQPGPYTYNPNALADITTTPDSLTDLLNASGVGGMGGLGSLPDPNILITGMGGVPVGAVWGGSDLVGGTGQLTIIMDVNWLENETRRESVSNIQIFLEQGVGHTVAVPLMNGWGMGSFTVLSGLVGAYAIRRRTRSRR